MTACFWCGESNNIVIGERLIDCKSDKQLGQKMFDGYEPCQTCQEKFAQGTLLIESAKEPITPEQPAMNKEETAYPTGNHWVVKTESMPEGFQVPIVFIEKEDAEAMGLYRFNKEGKTT